MIDDDDDDDDNDRRVYVCVRFDNVTKDTIQKKDTPRETVAAWLVARILLNTYFTQKQRRSPPSSSSLLSLVLLILLSSKRERALK